MPYLRFQCALQNDSVLERDAAVNVFHYRTDVTISDLNAAITIVGRLTAFYQAIQVLLSANLTGTVRCKVYNLLHAPDRFPIYDTTFTFTPSAPVPTYPNEVAICLSYRGVLTDSPNRRRNRGRIYVGPINGASAGVDDVGDMRVVATARTTLITAATDHLLVDNLEAPQGFYLWSVFSRANALGLGIGEPMPAEEPTYTNAQLDVGFRTIQQAWVDDAFDTQRRRGLRPVNRTSSV